MDRVFGYARVSTRKAKGRKEQHVDNQVDRLLALGIPRGRIYVDDGVSGRKASRPEWNKLLAAVHTGDKIIATSLTRIGRSTKNLLEIMSGFEARGIDVEFLDQSIDTSTPSGRLIFVVLAAIAEYEAEITAQRVTEGLEAAKDRHGGKLPGRGPSFTDKQRETAEKLLRETDFSTRQVAGMVGVSRSTLYTHVDVSGIREARAKVGGQAA
jgi:DNA invertase Pin-like site-specific DNA recombinase